jgi:hypothetical protein
MNKEAKIWEKINTPKIEELITGFDKNGKPAYILGIINPKDIPKITHKRKKNKKI